MALDTKINADNAFWMKIRDLLNLNGDFSTSLENLNAVLKSLKKKSPIKVDHNSTPIYVKTKVKGCLQAQARFGNLDFFSYKSIQLR